MNLFYKIVIISCLISLFSCQKEDNTAIFDSPLTVSDDPIKYSFPNGAKLRTIDFRVCEDIRTRTTHFDTQWDPFNNESGTLFVRYAIYDENGDLYYTSDSYKQSITISTVNFRLTYPAPEGHYKMFVWADKLGNVPNGYTINWIDKTVSMSDTPGITQANMSKLGDAWYCWMQYPIGSTSYHEKLRRAFMNVDILTDELRIKGIYDKFKDSTIITKLGFVSDSDKSTLKFPKVWHWDDDTFDFEIIKDGNYSFFCSPSINPRIIDQSYQLANALFFAPEKGTEIIDHITGEKYSIEFFKVETSDSSFSKTIPVRISGSRDTHFKIQPAYYDTLVGSPHVGSSSETNGILSNGKFGIDIRVTYPGVQSIEDSL